MVGGAELGRQDGEGWAARGFPDEFGAYVVEPSEVGPCLLHTVQHLTLCPVSWNRRARVWGGVQQVHQHAG